nr:hypothetical protein [Escherichia coli]
MPSAARAVRDVNGERFRFQVSIRCCRFNFSQGYRRQVNVRIAAPAVNGNSTGYIGNFTEEINPPPPTVVSAAWAAVMPKKRGCHCCREKNLFFIAISLSE